VIYPREIPFVKVIVPLMIGIALGYHFQVSLTILFPILFINFLLLGILTFLKLSPTLRKYFSFLFYSFFFILGITSITFSTKEKQIDSVFLNKKTSIHLEISDTPKYGNNISMRAIILDIDSTSEKSKNNFGELYVNLAKKDSFPQLQKGDQLYVYGSIKATSVSKNKNTFNFKGYLKTKGLHHQIFAQGKDWKLINQFDGFSTVNAAKKIQKSLADIILNYIPSTEESSIVMALVLGSKSNLDPSLRNAYANTGSLHVLAVSGLHVGLLYAFLIFIFKFSSEKSRVLKWIKFSIALIVIWSFTFISGAAPSVIRASTMLSLLLIAKNIQRFPNTYNIIAFTAFCMLIYNPWQLFDVSFQLSFLALLGIVFFHSRLYRSWYIKNWLGDKIWMLTALGISAQLGTFPIAIYYFHQFPIYFWLTGIFVVPFASVILGLGILLLVTKFTLPFLTPIIAKALHAVVWLMNALIYLIQEIPKSSLKGIWINEGMLVALYLAILMLAIAVALKNKKILFSTAAFVIGILSFNFIINLTKPPLNQLHIYHSYNNSRIEYFKDQTSHAYSNEGFEEINFSNLVNPLHEYLGISKTYYQLPNKISDSNPDGIDYYLINKLKIGVVKTAPQYKLTNPIDLDVLILTNNPRINLSELSQIVQPQYVIIDGSNPFWTINKWKKDFNKYFPNQQLFSTFEVGAMTIDFEKPELKMINGPSIKL